MKTHCKEGHAYTPENTYIRTDGYYECVVCKRTKSAKWYAENSERAKASAEKLRKANPEKARAQRRRWSLANPRKVAEARQKWLDANPEKNRESKRRWNAKNPERMKENARNWQKANVEKERERTRNWRAANIEKFRACVRASRAAHPEWGLNASRKRRARRRDADGSFRPWLLRYYRFRQNGKCWYCGIEMLREVPKEHPQKENLEHLVPLSRGGKHSQENTVLSCQLCNYRKYTKTAEEFQSSRTTQKY